MEQFEKTGKEKVKFFYFFHNCQERYGMISIIDQGSLDQRSPKFIMAATKIVNVRNRVMLRECPKKSGNGVTQHYIQLSVCGMSGIGVTRPNLHFFQYIQVYKPFADPVPPNTKQYQLILTKYQPVLSYTDPVP